MAEGLRITARNLGCFNLDSFCPACVKYLMHIKFHPPYNIHGGLFTDAQSCQEAILHYYLAKDGELPEEFGPFVDCAEVVDCNKHYSKYGCVHGSGVYIYGSPDEVLRRKDGSVCIIDHKSSRKNPDEDEFHGQYQTQVVGYSFIAEALGLGEVTLGGLLYWSAQVETVEANPAGHYKHGSLIVPMKPTPVEIKIDYRLLDPLMKEFKDLWRAKEVPAGRERCEDCKRREHLFAVEAQFNRQIQDALRDYSSLGWESRRREIRDQIFRRDESRRKLLAEFGAVGGGIYSPSGMMSNWEFLPLEDSTDSEIA